MTTADVSAALPMVLVAIGVLLGAAGCLAQPGGPSAAVPDCGPGPSSGVASHLATTRPGRGAFARRSASPAQAPHPGVCRGKGVHRLPGQAITDDVRITIAAQLACCCWAMRDRTTTHACGRSWSIQTHSLWHHERAGWRRPVQKAQSKALTGESWAQGQVVLSWAEALAGAADPADGRNVVLHEFAHQIDQDTGASNGRPWRPNPAMRRRWDRVMGAALRAAAQRTLSGDRSLRRERSGRSSFAVVTESFFRAAASAGG